MRRSETGNGAGPLLTDVTAERDQYRVLAAEREETIRDLRRRLDDSEDERRRVQERLTALLTHRQAGSVPSVEKTEVASDLRRPWWRRWFR